MLGLAGPAAAREVEAGGGGATPDALFLEAFGASSTRRAQAVPLGLEVEGESCGLVSTLLPRAGADAAAAARPLAAPVLAALAGRVSDEVQAQLAAAVEPSGHLPLGALRDAGLGAAFDASRLALTVDIPPRLRRTQVRTLGQPTEASADGVAPSRVSGFLNLRLAQDLAWLHTAQGGAERAGLRVGLEGALNVRGWVLEGRGELAEGAQRRLSRGDVRLVRDDTARAVRWVAGNLAAPATGFQPGRSLLGVSAARNFSLDPSRQTLPEEAVGFLLERSSRVEVLVNGRLVQTLQLPPGPHDLRGLLLDLGSNELELLITDDLGAQRRVTKRVGLASGQLAPGVSEFAHSVGFALQEAGASQGYDWSRPTLHLVHRQGIARALTLGASLQAEPHAQGLSLEPLWATFLGNVATSAALSHRAGVLGYGAGLRYELQRGGGSRLPSTFGLGAEYRSPGLALPGAQASLQPTGVLNAFWAQGLGAGIQGRLSGEARLQTLAARPAYAGSVALTKGFRNGLLLMVDGTARSAAQGRELLGHLNLLWAFPDAGRSVQASSRADSRTGPASQLGLNQELRAGNATVLASAGVGQDVLTRRLSASLAYRGPRAEAELSHRLVSVQGSAGRSLASAVQARMGLALVFADGLFALSRPVTSSFAIVAPTRALQGQWIGVNPGVRGYSGAADGLGPAVLPDLQPYAWSRLQVDAPGLPLGYSLGREVHTLRPTYRSGTVVRVGEEGSVLLRGVLRDQRGAPVALASGSAVRLAGTPEAPMPFFTNKTGRFVLSPLRPGTYLLRLDDPAQPTRFSIPEGAVGVFELGQVAVVLGEGASAREGAALVAREVRVGRAAPPAAAPPAAAPALPRAVLSTVRGRLYGDRNANRVTEPGEPVFAHVRVGAAGVTATTDAEGRFELEGVAGPEALLRVETPEALPFGTVPPEVRLALGAPEVVADLLVPAGRFPLAPSGPFTLALPEGRVRAVQLRKASFPLAAWAAGRPLSRAEARRLARLARRVNEGGDLRLLVVARAPAKGPLRGAVKRAHAGARALRHYLQATQRVPATKLGLTVVEPRPGSGRRRGRIDLVLVRVQPPAP